MINRKLIIGTESRTPSFKRKILATVRRFADAQQSQFADFAGRDDLYRDRADPACVMVQTRSALSGNHAADPPTRKLQSAP
jgi:hypothetical protein